MRGAVRRRELAAVIQALSTGRHTVVVGPAGSGRTALCAEVQANVSDLGRRCHVVRGTESVDGIPYAPFAEIFESIGLASVDGLTVLTRTPPVLADARDVVLVDDADLLDPASIVLTGHLARAGVSVAVTATRVDDLPRSMRDAIDTGIWQVLPLDPLAIDDVLAVAASVAGDELDAESAADVVAAARGNLRRVVALTSARSHGATRSPAGVRLGAVVADDALRSLVSDDLTTGERAWVELIAAAGRLPLQAFTPEERGGFGPALRVSGDTVEVDDPVLRDLVLADADPGRVAAARREAIARLDDVPDWAARRTALRVAVGDAVPVAERIAACELLGRRAAAPSTVLQILDGLDGPPTALLLRGAAASELGLVDAALIDLEAATAGEDPDVLGRAAHELGVLHAIRRADPATAVDVVESLLPRVAAPDRADRAAELVKWRLMAGLDRPEDDGSDPSGSVTESVIGAMIGSLDGPLAAAVSHVRDGMARLDAGQVAPPFSRDLLQLSGFLADVFAGDLDRAEAMARRRRDDAVATADPSLGMWEMATAELALHDGSLELGLQIATRAQRHLAWRDFTGLGPTNVALRAALAARTGRQVMALDLAPTVEPHRGDVKVHVHLQRVEAERTRRSKDPGSASRLLSDAGRRAISESHTNLGLLAIDEAVMLRPHEDDVTLLVEHAAVSPLFALLAARAEVMLHGDADRLAELVDDLESMGLLGRAAHAAFAAATFLSDAPERAKRLRSRAVVLASSSTRWACDDRADILTGRELDVARLAAQRMRSREIASTLGLSARTVDNHLGRVFRKLGVTGRDELRDALGLAAPEPH